MISEVGTPDPDGSWARQLREAGFDRASLTRDGEDFFDENPGVMDEFAESALELLGPESARVRQNYERLGHGRWAVVYAREPEDEHCIKVSTPSDMRINTKQGQVVKSPLNLAVDMRFMNLVHHTLVSGSDQGVYAPSQYAVVGLRQARRMNYALLQERLPRGLVSIDEYLKTMGEPFEWDDLKEFSGVVKGRVGTALGSTIMAGIGDLMVDLRGPGSWQPNSRNTWLEADKPIAETAIHLVDLVRWHGRSRHMARLLGRLRQP